MVKEIFGKKLGMTQIFDENGNRVGVTLIEIDPVCILEKVSYLNKEKVKVGCFKVPNAGLSRVKKPLAGYFKKIGVPPYRLIREVDYDPSQEFSPKSEVGIDIFKEGQKVAVSAKTKGRGFQGGMKRHGWRGQPKTHGSTTHRRIGSAGASAYPSRIIKGLRMPGHMGDSLCTVRNLTVVKIDAQRQVLFLKGAVPGGIGGLVSIKTIDK